MRKRLLMASIAAIAVFSSSAAVALAEEEPSAIDPELMERTLSALHEAGAPAVIAEVRDGSDSWAQATGKRVIGEAEPPETTDRSRVASITKSMVATVLLQLSQEGSVKLDDPIAELNPELLPYSETITVRQLLNHTSGIPDYFFGIYPSMENGDPADMREHRLDAFSPRQLIDLAAARPLEFPPGTDFTYSNTNYIVLGMLIEQLTAQPLDVVLTERILRPSGMDNSYFATTDPVITGPHPHSYLATGEPAEPLLDTTELHPSQFWAAGALIADPDDVNDFFRAMSNGTLLSPELLAEARTLTEQSQGRYGLGLETFPMPEECSPVPDGVAYGHTGGGYGYTTVSFHSPGSDRQLTFTMTVDVQLAPSDELSRAFLNLIHAGLCSIDELPADAVADSPLPPALHGPGDD